MRSRFKAARLMRRVAEARLVEHELIVGRFYLKKKAYTAAIERLQKALGEFPDSSMTGDMYLSLGEAMLRSGDSEQGRFYLDRVIDDYADGVALAASGAMSLEPIVSPELDLDEAARAFELVHDSSSLKVLMKVG